MGSKKQPDMPDMPDPAQLIELAARTNRVNTSTPFGSQTYLEGPDGSTTLRTDIGPLGEALVGRAAGLGLTDSDRLSVDPRLNQLAGGVLGRVGQRFGMDLSGPLQLGPSGGNGQSAKPPGQAKPGNQPMPNPSGPQAPGGPVGSPAPHMPGASPGAGPTTATTQPGGWEAMFNGRMPRTTLPPGSGRGSLPWANPIGPSNPGFGMDRPGGGIEDGEGFWAGIGDRFGDGFRNIGDNIRDNFSDVTFQNGGQGFGRFALNYLAPGLGNLFMPRPVDPRLANQANQNMQAGQQDLQNNYMNRTTQGIHDGLMGGFPALPNAPEAGQTQQQGLQDYYNSRPIMSQREMDRIREQFGFVNLFGSGQLNEFANNVGQEALEWNRRVEQIGGQRMR